LEPLPIKRLSPYQGLVPYMEGDAPFFFGRGKETRLIIANLFASPLTLLYGASGVGKSSVIRAGVVHQLRQRDDLIAVPFSVWRDDPVGDLGRAIVNSVRSADAGASANVKNILDSNHSSLRELLISCFEQMGRRLMIILDQFEEYFLYHPLGDAFDNELPSAIIKADAPVSFLICVREDALAKLDRFEGCIPSLFDNYLRIEHLSREAAYNAIVRPIERYNELGANDQPPINIEPSLVEAILKQVQAGKVIFGEAGRGMIRAEETMGQIETPFLQMVMTRLWDEEMRAGSRVLQLKTLERLGGAEHIVRTHLDETMSELTQDKQDIAAKIFHHLVTPSGTKIVHTVHDLAEYSEQPKVQILPILEELASSGTRILRGVGPPPEQPEEPRYEIFHDVLAPAILDWRVRHVKKQERAETERKLAQARRRVNRLLLGVVALILLLLLMTGLSIYAFRIREEAKRQTRLAQQSEVAALNAQKEEAAARQQADETLNIVEKEKERADDQARLAKQEKQRADEQAKLASRREAEAKTEEARAEQETYRAIELLKSVNEIALEMDPEKRESLRRVAVGFDPRLTRDQERRKTILESRAFISGKEITRIPQQYGLKLWANGATLRIKFMNGDSRLHDMVKRIAPEWSRYANLHFKFVSEGDAEIRIDLEGSRPFGYIGTDALGINQLESTMALDINTSNLSDEQKKGQILHEFGHVLGLIHETNSPNANIPWDIDAAYRFLIPYKWTKEQVDALLVEKYKDIEYRQFDPKSVMMWAAPKELIKGGIEFSDNNNLSEGDKAFARKLYPPSR
jgi:hypothetical protein